MPLGKVHKGKMLVDVPPEYLLSLLDSSAIKHFPELREYIIDNKETLKQKAGIR